MQFAPVKTLSVLSTVLRLNADVPNGVPDSRHCGPGPFPSLRDRRGGGTRRRRRQRGLDGRAWDAAPDARSSGGRSHGVVEFETQHDPEEGDVLGTHLRDGCGDGRVIQIGT